MSPPCTFGVYNLVSNNPGMRWDIDALRDELGFVPQDGKPMRASLAHRIKAGMAWLRDVALPKIADRLAGARW